jgi:hypothetical protein
MTIQTLDRHEKSKEINLQEKQMNTINNSFMPPEIERQVLCEIVNSQSVLPHILVHCRSVCRAWNKMIEEEMNVNLVLKKTKRFSNSLLQALKISRCDLVKLPVVDGRGNVNKKVFGFNISLDLRINSPSLQFHLNDFTIAQVAMAECQYTTESQSVFRYLRSRNSGVYINDEAEMKISELIVRIGAINNVKLLLTFLVSNCN